MFAVVCKVRPNIYSAYRDSKIAASIVAIYDKIRHVEPTTSQALVRYIATQAETIIKTMNGTNPPLLPGYRIKYLDGNCIESTEHRLGVLRETKAAPLPIYAIIMAALRATNKDVNVNDTISEYYIAQDIAVKK